VDSGSGPNGSDERLLLGKGQKSGQIKKNG
jgi:hypothetical protein